MIIRPSKTIAEKVLKILEDEILSGRYKPGDRVVEREIAERLGVSRIPVREALLALERRGFVKAKVNNRKGREIVGISEREISENYAIRELIEEYALTEKSLQQENRLLATLKQIVEEMEKFVQMKDLESYRNFNSKFHHEIAQSLNNKKLYNIYSEAAKSTHWFQNLTLYAPRMEESIQEHKLLLKSYEEKDLLKIRSLMKNHYNQAVEFLTKKLKVHKNGS
jgi:DNA-binding GntR family transcriptional regulator